jgi:catechol 2,3-dioxygenase-like lactoylglutathione lyase family enzyme
MSIVGIDHLVIAVADPDAAAADLEASLGLGFTGGGRHERGGTFNRLAFLGETYVELIGVFDRGLARSSGAFAVGQAAMAMLDDGLEGLVTYALRSDDVAADVARLRGVGSEIDAPVAGSRTRPDGETVRWITAFTTLGPAEPPFLIEHVPTGVEWGPQATAARATYRHPVGGALRLTAMELPVPDLAAAVDRYRSVLRIAFTPDGWAAVGGQGIRLFGAEPGDPPLVRIAADDRAAPAAVVDAAGVRWVREPT